MKRTFNTDMKRLKVILTSFLVAAVALTLAPASVAADGFVFEDDFESYSEGTVPSPNWYANAWDGGQPYDCKVRLFEGNKVFSLYSRSWAAVGSAQIDPLLDYSFEADVYMLPADPWPGNGPRLCLRNVNRNTYHLRGGYYVSFDPYFPKVSIGISDYPNLDYVLGEVPYDINFDTWYKVKAQVTGDTYGDITIQAFVDDMVTPVLEVVDDGSKWVSYRGDVAGYTSLYNGYSGLIYHDNVKIYEGIQTQCAPTATATGTACFATSNGSIEDLTAVATPSGAPTTFPHGMFTLKVTGLSSGEEVTLTIELPDPVPIGTKWWKYHNNTWSPMDIGDDDGDNVITVALQDGRTPDDEDTTPGQITDQGGPGDPGAVGWETYPTSKVRVLLPWIALGAVIVAGAGVSVLRRRRAQSQTM